MRTRNNIQHITRCSKTACGFPFFFYNLVTLFFCFCCDVVVIEYMAKPKHIAAEKRYGTVSADELDQLASRMEDLAAGVRAHAQSMRELQLPEIKIDGATKWDRGVELLADYFGNVTKKLAIAKMVQK